MGIERLKDLGRDPNKILRTDRAGNTESFHFSKEYLRPPPARRVFGRTEPRSVDKG